MEIVSLPYSNRSVRTFNTRFKLKIFTGGKSFTASPIEIHT
jgi:hypothetical protein